MDERARGLRERIGARRGRSLRVAPQNVRRFRVLGLVALGSVASLATAGALLGSGRPSSLVAVFLGTSLASGALAGGLARSLRSGTARSLPVELSSAWERRPGGWLFFLIGCLLALPVISLYSRLLPADNDSARLLASILHVQREGIDHLVESQEVLLPHLVLGPFVSLGGIPALQAVDVLSVIGLAGVVAFLSWRLTGSTVGAMAGVLALTALPQVLRRALLVPMYPAMLAFGFLGLWFAFRAITSADTGRRWRAAALAGVCLVLSMEAHQIGQFFVILTAVFLVAVPSRRAAAGLGRVYACLALFYIPRAAINLADGGFSHFFSNRVEYWVTKGYLQTIQEEVLNYPRGLSLSEYLGRLPEALLDSWGATGWLTLALGAIFVFVAPARLRRFIVACTLLFLLVVVRYQLPFFPRYFSLLLVGSALAAGGTVAALARRPSLPWRLATGAVVAALVVVNVLNYQDQLDRFRPLATPYRQLAAQIRPGEGVIGTRSFHLNDTSTSPSTYGQQFLSESEYRTFLTWPSDAEVIELMRRHDARWVFVPDRRRRWVVRYNDVWLGSVYGEEARYHREVARSPSFCLAKRAHGAVLYRLDLGGRARADQAPRRCGT